MKPKPTLPQLAQHVDALQTCVYCPKLCRAACPVSNATASETLTPWGKMSLGYFVHRADIPRDESHALPAWACSTCNACRERCEHDNAVATVLSAARRELCSAGVEPAGARAVIDGWLDHQAALRGKLDELEARRNGSAPTALLVGCSYVRLCPDVARAVLAVTAHLVKSPLRVVRSCCGLPLLLAGDGPGFVRAAHALADELTGASRVIVADPGCARTLLEQYPPLGLAIGSVEPLVDVIRSGLGRVPARRLQDERLRYHDPCQLGRGLGRYEEPRAILQHLTGRAPLEFVRTRAESECSGGGGLLPLTFPEASQAIADARIAEHREAGGGRLVTACGGALHRFRSRGEDAVDLVSLVAQALSHSS